MIDDPFFYVSLIIFVSLALLFVIILTKNRTNPLSVLNIVIFVCAIASMIFDEENPIGFFLVGAAIVLSIWEIFRKLRKEI
jgi:hypothetical protein